MTQQATDRINTCCTNIENASSKEEIQNEVNEIRSCCGELNAEQTQKVQSCCTNIENAESKEMIREETEKIRGCCA